MDKLKIRRMMDDRRGTKRILTGFFVSLLSSLFLFSSSFVPLPSSFVYAEIPHLINYQGRLTDKEGKPVADGTYSITFRIYDALGTGSIFLWEEIYDSRLEGSRGIVIEKGIFSVLLGELNNGKGENKNLRDLPFNEPYYLEIKVGDDEPLKPKQPIASAGYAMRAQEAENAEKANQAQNANQALNANTVANVGVSTTPQANKLLPLDSNARLPAVDGSQLMNTLKMKIGTYQGNGGARQTITGVGLKPQFLTIFCHKNRATNLFFKNNQMGVNAHANADDGSGGIYYENEIVSLDADGFTVGDGSGSGRDGPNLNGETYSYVAYGY